MAVDTSLLQAHAESSLGAAVAQDLPARARIVVIGGGIAGGSIAFHLAEMGCTDVVVLDRHELTSGSTFHSAGLVGQLRSSLPLTRMMMHSVEVYKRLETMGAGTGRFTDWTQTGSLRLASTDERWEELKRQHGWSKTFGLETHLLSPTEAQNLFPMMTTADVRGALYMATDGHLDPSSVTNAFFGAARDMGVTVRTHTNVTGFVLRNGRVHGVETDRGTIECDSVIIAGGMFSTQIAALAGVNVPIVPMAHQYLFTKPIEGVHRELPSMRDPDKLVYFRNQGGGLVMGGYERNPMPWSLKGVPRDFNYKLLDADWGRFEPLMHAAIERVPVMENAEILQLLNGPEGFTPDNEFILGESEVHGLFVAAGFCAHGIAGAGGVGRVMAEWVLDGEPSFDTWKMDIRRFGPHFRSRDFALARTYEVYSTYYDIHYPNEERHAGRPLRRSATYPALVALGCEFGEKSMWERPNWFPSNDADGKYEHLRPSGWAGQHWHSSIIAEALACRSTAALFDESSFAKFRIEGPNALALLQRLCANDVDKPVGALTYTQMLNDRGGIECDFTVTRLAEDSFQIVTGTAFGLHDRGWISKQAELLPQGTGVRITDVTAAYTCLGLWGPRARDILSALTSADLSNDAFPYLSAQNISVGPVPCLALRVTYVGELGWELYCPTEYGAALWDLVMEAGTPHGMVPGGYRAIEALRLEKGYRAWAAEISPEDTPLEAGLGFAVAFDKPGGFLGREALLTQKAAGITRRLVALQLDDPTAVALGSEPVRALDGAVLGRVTSGGYGPTVAASIAYAYVPTALAVTGGRVEVELFGTWIGATVSVGALFDPKGDRIKQ
jgi:glycine cleavage system T protein